MVIRSSCFDHHLIEGLWNYLIHIINEHTKNQTKETFMKKDLKDLLIDELHDLLSAEEQIVEALPEVAKASESPELKDAFESHLKETKGQVQRLEKIFKLLQIPKKEKHCKAMKGLIQECSEVLKDFKTKSPVRDAALISKAQRIEHYEIAAYGTVHEFARELDLDAVADLLDETLYEEGNADKKLTKIAKGGLFKLGINKQAHVSNSDKSKVLNNKENHNEKNKNPNDKKPKSEAPKRKPALAHK